LGRHRQPGHIRLTPKSNWRSKSSKHTTQLPLREKRSSNGTLALANVIWNMPTCQLFHRLHRAGLTPSRSFRLFIGKHSTFKNPAVRPRGSLNKRSEEHTSELQ